MPNHAESSNSTDSTLFTFTNERPNVFLLISLFSGRCSSKSLQLGAESFDRKKPNGAGTAGDGEETCSRK